MSQCVPSWDLDSPPPPPPSRLSLRCHSNPTTDVPAYDYEVAELTWENGQVAMHGLGLPRIPSKLPSWEKPRATGTLESVVNQATGILPRFSKQHPFENTIASATGGCANELVTWLDQHHSVAASDAPSTTVAVDALVPCSRNNQPDERNGSHIIDSVVSAPGTAIINGCSTRVGSCSAAAFPDEDTRRPKKQAASVSRVPATPEWSSRSPSVSGSATFGMDSQHVTPETKGSDRDSACHSRPQREASDDEGRNKKRSTGKSSVSTKRSRAAAIHNQSERKRRDKINQRMKTLQKLVPNSSKPNKMPISSILAYLSCICMFKTELVYSPILKQPWLRVDISGPKLECI